MSTIYVTAVIIPEPGMTESVRAELAKVIPLVRTEPGCIRYDLHEGNGDTPTFLFYEIWENEDALKVHGGTPHLKAMQEALTGMVASSEVNTWTEVDVLSA